MCEFRHVCVFAPQRIHFMLLSAGILFWTLINSVCLLFIIVLSITIVLYMLCDIRNLEWSIAMDSHIVSLPFSTFLLDQHERIVLTDTTLNVCRDIIDITVCILVKLVDENPTWAQNPHCNVPQIYFGITNVILHLATNQAMAHNSRPIKLQPAARVPLGLSPFASL